MMKNMDCGDDVLTDCKEAFLKALKDDKSLITLKDKILDIPDLPKPLDQKCYMEIKKKIIRIEYPGEVINIDKAIKTLGGMTNIETSVGEHKARLTLNFHPKNLYSKKCFADKDFESGILIKVKKKKGSSEKLDYEVVGLNVMSFTFNRMCDFQYLPLIAKPPETKTSEVEYIYEQILPKELPNYEWLNDEKSKDIASFLVPVCFSRFDSLKTKFNCDESSELDFSNESLQKAQNVNRKKIGKIFGKAQNKISCFASFNDKEIPTKPSQYTLKIIEKYRTNRAFVEKYENAKKLFEERPIWTKSAAQYVLGLSNDSMKIILSALAYHFKNGPFRVAWVRFGYDPRNDPNSRIYQVFDYRIRTSGIVASVQLKVESKRSYRTSKPPISVTKRISLNENISAKPKLELDERCYILRPGVIPPARQMFYQFCDLLLPEVQEALSKLPNVSSGKVCDLKTGWLPQGFIDKCRQIVNKYILEAVQKELLEDKIVQEKAKRQIRMSKTKDKMDYCDLMMSNIKKGIYKNVNLSLPGTSKDPDDGEEDVEPISLSSDEEDVLGDLFQNTIPENLNDEDDDEYVSEAESQSSNEPEIDMEAVQEINEMLANMKQTK